MQKNRAATFFPFLLTTPLKHTGHVFHYFAPLDLRVQKKGIMRGSDGSKTHIYRRTHTVAYRHTDMHKQTNTHTDKHNQTDIGVKKY